MKKRKNKPQHNLEVGALLEDFNSKFDLVMEQTGKIPDIKTTLGSLVDTIDIIKTDIELMKYGLKIKVDVDEFKALEKRVSMLESKR